MYSKVSMPIQNPSPYKDLEHLLRQIITEENVLSPDAKSHAKLLLAELEGQQNTPPGEAASNKKISSSNQEPAQPTKAEAEEALLKSPMKNFGHEAMKKKAKELLSDIQYKTADGLDTSVLEGDLRLLFAGEQSIEEKIAKAKQRGRNARKEKERLRQALRGGVCGEKAIDFWKELPKRVPWFLNKASKEIVFALRKELEWCCKQKGRAEAEQLLCRARKLYGLTVFNVALPADCEEQEPIAPIVVPQTVHTLFSRKPIQEWDIYIDETGERFSDEQMGREGRVVAVCVPQGCHLPNLGAFHSTEAGSNQVWKHFTTLLESDCAIFGCTREALNIQGAEGWLQCIRELIKWVWRLLPLQTNGQPVRLAFHVEQRSGYTQDLETALGTKMLAAELEREDAIRAKQMRLFHFAFEDKKAPMLAWADIVSHLWGKTAKDDVRNFRASGLLGTSLVDCDPKVLKICEQIFKGEAPNDEDWVLLMEQGGDDDSLESYSRTRLQEQCKENPALWDVYAKAMEKYLLSKHYQMSVLERMSTWLEPMESKNAATNFFRHMANLAHCNHLGDVCSTSFMQTVTELEHLAPEIGKLDPMAPLHMALRLSVSDTNAFDFASAETRLAAWNPTLQGKLTGSALWDGKIISSLGQLRAFQNDLLGARRFFKEALTLFSSLEQADPKRAASEQKQTRSYLAVAEMDSAGFPKEEVQKTVEAALGMAITDAPRELNQLPLGQVRYQHYLLARYLVCVGSEEEKAAYLRFSSRWTNPSTGFEPGHPWPQIQYFRWLLADDFDALASAIKKSFMYARGRDGMPTLELIVVAIAISMGILNPDHKPVRTFLLRLGSMLRGADPIVRQLLAAAPGEKHLARRLIPFNFC